MCTIHCDVYNFFIWVNCIEMGERNWIGCLLRKVGTIDGTQTGNDLFDSMVNRLGIYFEWLNRELLQIIFLLRSFSKNLTRMGLIIHPLAVYKCFGPFLKSYPLLKIHRTVDILGKISGKRKINRGFHLSLWALLTRLLHIQVQRRTHFSSLVQFFYPFLS